MTVVNGSVHYRARMLTPRNEKSCLAALVLLSLLHLGSAFVAPSPHLLHLQLPSIWSSKAQSQLYTSQEDGSPNTEASHVDELFESLAGVLDKYILSGSPRVRERAFNVLDQIAAADVEDGLVKRALRMVKRAGMPMNKTFLSQYANELSETDPEKRRLKALKRLEEKPQGTSQVGDTVAKNVGQRSALSRRDSGKPDLFMSSVLNPDSIATIPREASNLKEELDDDAPAAMLEPSSEDYDAAADQVSEVVAKTGGGASFEGESLGIGGLDDVLAQVKRRVWTPLAAPPKLLDELGIHPVRGLLLYGKPGCGKTLLARTLGNILSPMRPITVVSGPEIMDKFVGSSEKNLREIFDSPPDIHRKYRNEESDGGNALARAALHVVVLDEFDAVARTRGGRGGKGEQGDAGVARDSVVNQMLAKMDGVQPLPVPTLVIGLTNKRSLIEPALLRPGRFEVQVEVPPPRTTEQRVSILKVHTKDMHAAGRLLVNDPPAGTAAQRYLETHNLEGLPSYTELLEMFSQTCEGFSGAALAGVARAAASHALERAVGEFSENDSSFSIMDCLVTHADFDEAVEDVRNGMGNTDHSEHEQDDEDLGDEDTDKAANFAIAPDSLG